MLHLSQPKSRARKVVLAFAAALLVAHMLLLWLVLFGIFTPLSVEGLPTWLLPMALLADIGLLAVVVPLALR